MKKRAPIVRLCEFLGVYSADYVNFFGVYSVDYVKNMGGYGVDYVKSVIFAHIINESEYG